MSLMSKLQLLFYKVLNGTMRNIIRLNMMMQLLSVAVILSVSYTNDRHLPDKAIDLMDKAWGKICQIVLLLLQ